MAACGEFFRRRTSRKQSDREGCDFESHRIRLALGIRLYNRLKPSSVSAPDRHDWKSCPSCSWLFGESESRNANHFLAARLEARSSWTGRSTSCSAMPWRAALERP